MAGFLWATWDPSLQAEAWRGLSVYGRVHVHGGNPEVEEAV